MMRRRNTPPKRGQVAPRRAQDKERELESELRAARANRKASSAQKQQLRRLEWDDDPLDETSEEKMFGDESVDGTDEDSDDESAAR